MYIICRYNLNYLKPFLVHNTFYSFRPPEGCLQWHTGASGKLKSFNGGHSGTQQMIKDQNYDICIRTEMGKYLVASL